jgi:hypothetical protein
MVVDEWAEFFVVDYFSISIVVLARLGPIYSAAL